MAVGRLVVGRGHPDAAAAALPAVGELGAVGLLLGDVAVEIRLLGLGGPGAEPAVGRLLIVGRVALGGGNGVPAPHLLAAAGVVGGDVAPDAVLAAGDAHDDVVAHDQGRVGDAVPEGRVGHFLVPEDFAGLGVERYQVGVEGPHVDVGPSVNRDATVVRAAAEDRGPQLVGVAPELLVRIQIVRHRRVVGRRDVHDATLHDRRILEGAKSVDPGLEDLPDRQLADVAGGDLLERGVPLIPIVAAVGGPVALRGSRARQGQEHRDHRPSHPHRHTQSPSGVKVRHGRQFGARRLARCAPVRRTTAIPSEWGAKGIWARSRCGGPAGQTPRTPVHGRCRRRPSGAAGSGASRVTPAVVWEALSE